MNTPILSLPECTTILRPHHEQIRSIFFDAWDQYQELLRIAPYLADYRRGRANDVHAAMKALAKQVFGETSSDAAYYIPHEPESFMVIFGRYLHTKFKKLDRE